MVAARERNFLRKLCAASSAIGAMLSAKGKLFADEEVETDRRTKYDKSTRVGASSELKQRQAR
jgi:hypothetical protein